MEGWLVSWFELRHAIKITGLHKPTNWAHAKNTWQSFIFHHEDLRRKCCFFHILIFHHLWLCLSSEVKDTACDQERKCGKGKLSCHCCSVVAFSRMVEVVPDSSQCGCVEECESGVQFSPAWSLFCVYLPDNPRQSSHVPVYIRLLDINDNAPTFAAVYETFVCERTKAGQVLQLYHSYFWKAEILCCIA